MTQVYPWYAKITGTSLVNRYSNDMLSMPCGCDSGLINTPRSTTLTTRTLIPGTCFCSSHEAAHVSSVGTSPAQASTMSGVSPPSLVANFQIEAPLEQCAMASSMVSHCNCDCFPQVITFT